MNDWNKKQTAHNKFRAYVGYINYKGADGKWWSIDTTIIDAGSEFIMNKAPFFCSFPKLSTGTATMTANNKHDIFKKEDITAPDFIMSIDAPDVDTQNPVQGQLIDINGDGKFNAVLYPMAFPQWDADLVYYVEPGRAPKLKKLILAHSDAIGGDKAEFHMGYSHAPEISSRKIPQGLTRRQHRDECHGRLNTPIPVDSDEGFYVRMPEDLTLQKRGIGIKEFEIKDSAGKVATIQADIRKHGQGFKLTKYIPSDFFDAETIYPVAIDAVFTINPDGHIETSTFDGYAWRGAVNETWANITANAGSGSIDNINRTRAPQILASTTLDRYAFNLRGKQTFDILVVGLESIAGIKIGEFGRVKTNGLGASPGYNIYEATTVSETAMTPGDYNIATFGTTELIDTVEYDDYDIGVYNISDFNAAGIASAEAALAGTGIWKLGIVNPEYDMAQVQPPWGSSLESHIDHGTAETVGEEPYVEITTVEAGAGPLINGGLINTGLIGGRLVQ